MSTPEHRTELRRLGLFTAVFAAFGASTYAVPGLAELRPWLPGEPVPLVHLLTTTARVEETATGELIVVEEPQPPVALTSTAGAAAAPSPEAPPDRARTGSLTDLPIHAPAGPVLLEAKPGALDAWFSALAAAEDGEPGRVVRALHWGDSTIAADGFASTVRARLSARFGDAGPGFLAVHVDPAWSLRPGVLRTTEGGWESHNITFGGIDSSRYGLAGVVSTAPTQASATLGGHKTASGRQPITRFDVYYQAQPGGGTLNAKARGSGGFSLSTAADKASDRYKEIRSPGSSTLYLEAAGDGPVTVYGVSLETSGPGVTWESFGVAGSSIGSLTRQSKAHLSAQVARRDPDLLVYMTGGNEVGYPSLSAGEGEKYREAYGIALAKLRAGAPDASCLILGPLDQAVRERGAIKSKPMLARMIQIQREVALEQGCAFWDTRASMGGDGGFARFLNHQPRYAWTDLMHLTAEGLDLVGQSFADAVLLAYDIWRKDHPEAGYKAPPAPPAPVAPAAPAAPTAG